MGVHIVVYKPEGDWPVSDIEWDSLRYGHDRDFLNQIIYEVELKEHPTTENLIAPYDVDKVRKLINETDWDEFSKQRYQGLCDLFEQGCWMHVSY